MKDLFIIYIIRNNLGFSFLMIFLFVLTLLMILFSVITLITTSFTMSSFLLLIQMVSIPFALYHLSHQQITLFLSKRFSGLFLSFNIKHLLWYYYEANLTFEQIRDMEAKIAETQYDILIDKSLLYSGLDRLLSVYGAIKDVSVPNTGILVKNPNEYLSIRMSIC